MSDEWSAMSVGSMTGAGLDRQTDAMIGNFQSAVASGDTQEIVVELEALEQYYDRLWEFHDVLERSMSGTHETTTAAHEKGLEADTDGLRGSQPRIDGVINAVYASRHIAGNAHAHGLAGSLSSLRNQVTKNLVDVYDCYSAYLQADTNGSDDLNRTGLAL